jgi:hypothetical protein
MSRPSRRGGPFVMAGSWRAEHRRLSRDRGCPDGRLTDGRATVFASFGSTVLGRTRASGPPGSGAGMLGSRQPTGSANGRAPPVAFQCDPQAHGGGQTGTSRPCGGVQAIVLASLAKFVGCDLTRRRREIPALLPRPKNFFGRLFARARCHQSRAPSWTPSALRSYPEKAGWASADRLAGDWRFVIFRSGNEPSVRANPV